MRGTIIAYLPLMTPSRLPLGGAQWVDHLARHAYGKPGGVAIRFQGESPRRAATADKARITGTCHRAAALLASARAPQPR